MQPALLLKLYRQLLRLRRVEEQIAERYADQQMRCPVHLSIGQEAVPVGVCAHLTNADYAISGHRAHNHYLAKGGDLKRMIAEIYGKETGCSRGKGGSMHLIDLSVGFLGATPIVGSTIPIGVGAALGAVMAGEKRVSIVFFGEGATEEGVFHEAVNFAVLKNLPVVFVCENNLYSVYSGLEVRQPKGREVCQVAGGHGVASSQGDGNDISEVHRRAGEAIERARRGQGPSFLEFATYRWLAHCGPSSDIRLGYRTQEELDTWKKRCPLLRAKEQLVKAGSFSEEWEKSSLAEINAEIEGAFAFAADSPFPVREELSTLLYAERG